MPTKFGFHAFHINLYLHEFFEPILFSDPMDHSPWSEGKFWVHAKCAAYIVLLILEQWISFAAVPTKLYMSLLYALCIILCKKCNVFRCLLSSQLSLQGLSFLVLSCGSFPKFFRESSCYLPPLPLDSAAQPNNRELN